MLRKGVASFPRRKIMSGIDVSKETLSCTLLDSATPHKQWHKEVHNTPMGWKQLLKQTAPAVPWVLEPTGRYSLEPTGRPGAFINKMTNYHLSLDTNQRISGRWQPAPARGEESNLQFPDSLSE
jgi:hypothetical protein